MRPPHSARVLLSKVGREAFPNGGALTCTSEYCGFSRPCTAREAGRFLAKGWPRCFVCGGSMRAHRRVLHPRGKADPDRERVGGAR